MGHNDHIDFELYELITDAVDEGYIEEGTPAHGISKQVVDRGYDSLSDKQRWVYDTVVVPALEKLERDREVERLVAKDRT